MPKQILILGGTMFTGRALVETLRQNPDYELKLFNRGKTNADLFPEVNQIHGNRETEDIGKVLKTDWDCVIDFSGYYPHTFQKFLTEINSKTKRYIFISTISVFDLGDLAGQVITESSPTLSCSEEQKISKLPDAYGEKKAEMERLLLAQESMEVIILRPSFIYGKYDWTDRFYYWLYRANFSEKVLMPEEFELALTYAGDLVAAIVNAIEVKQQSPVYNCISHSSVSLKQVVEIAVQQLNRKIDFVNAGKEMMEKNRLDAGAFPLFVPMNLTIQGNNWLKDFNVTPANFTQSVSETIEYCKGLGWPKPKAGLSIEKEMEAIAGL